VSSVFSQPKGDSAEDPRQRCRQAPLNYLLPRLKMWLMGVSPVGSLSLVFHANSQRQAMGTQHVYAPQERGAVYRVGCRVSLSHPNSCIFEQYRHKF
jgi:hypothetical protein